MARRRNRNYRKNVRGKVFPVVWAVVLLGAMSVALGYIWLSTLCDGLGRRIKDLEQAKVAVHRRVVNEEFKWSRLTTYENMMKVLEKHHVAMDWPREASMVRMRRPEAASDRARGDGALARN